MEKEKLPKSFVRQAHVYMEIQRLEEQVAGVNRAVQTFAAEDLPTDLEFFIANAKTQADFRAWVTAQEVAYTAQLGFLPKKEKERIHSSFSELADRVESARNVIGTFIFSAKYPIRQDLSGRIDYDWDKVREVLAKRNTYTYTPEDKEYYQVLLDAQEALNRIAQWEQEHTYAPIARMFNVGELLASSFSAQWFQENIGVRIGRSNAEALRMIREQEED